MREIVGVEISLWCRCEDGPDELRITDAVVVGCEADDVVSVAIVSRAMSGVDVPDNCLLIPRFLVEALRAVCSAESVSQSVPKRSWPGEDI